MIKTKMRVKKRDGTFIPVRLDEITDRIASLSKDLDQKVIDPVKITVEVVEKIHDGIPTSHIDSFTAEICHTKAIEHPHFNTLASRLIISDHQKTIHIMTDLKFSEVCKLLNTNTDQLGEHSSLISDELFSVSQEFKDVIDNMIDNERDFLLDYFGFKTLVKSYLLKIGGKVVETPQHMFMRVALGIHGKFKFDNGVILEPNFELIKETYDLLSTKYFTHATPTLYNAGTKKGQLFSCFEENTLVDTLNGPKPIKNVVIGDEVITHKGNVKKVQQIHKNLLKDREIYELKIRKTTPLKVTGNHKLWTYNDGNTEWKAVDQLTNGDYIGIPNYNGTIEKKQIDLEQKIKEIFEKNGGFDSRETVMEEVTYDDHKVHLNTSWFNNHLNNGEPILVTKQNSSINKIIEIDEYFCRFLGIWYGDGHISHRKDKQGCLIPIGIGITTSQDNYEMISFCTEISKYFGIEPSFHELKDQNTFQILYNSKILGAVFEHMYGKGFDGKILPTDIFKYSTKLVVAFIEGLISSDGCISKKGNITLCMANKELIEQIYTLCRLHNFDVTCPNKTTGGKLTKHQAYQLNLTCMRYILKDIYKTYKDDRIENLSLETNTKNQFSIIEHNGFKFLPFESKNIINIESEYVYTLGVEDDHSYSIGGIIAENCFLIGMDDSLKSIYKVLGDCADISKWAGGIGIHVHNIRANGSYIRGTGGKGDGLVPMLKVYNDTARYVNQGGRRSGSFAIYLEPWHADIQDFLKCKLPHGDENRRARDLFYALWIPDLFMERVKNNESWSLMCPSECPGLANVYGKEFKKLYEKYEKEGRVVKTINAQDLFHDIVKSQIETGTPYMTYKDAANYKSNQKNIGTIKSSNLCVAPETRILTKDGYYEIKDLVNKHIEVWNGTEWSETEVKLTGTNQKLIKVTLSNGSVINCTEYHKFITEIGSRPSDKPIEKIVEAKDLTIDMKLIKHDLPIITSGPEFKYAYTHGLFCSDGTYCYQQYGKQKRQPKITLYGEKKNLIDHLEIRTSSYEETSNSTINVMLPFDIPEKYTVPINFSLVSKLEWFAGVCDGDGTVCTNGENQSIQVGSIHKKYLIDIQLMLQTIGVNAKVAKSQERRITEMSDGKGGIKNYECQEIYRLLINGVDTQHLIDIGFSTKRLKIVKREIQRSASHFTKIISIENEDRFDDTYCFTESKRNRGMFEGVLLGNCSEIMEYSDTEKYACCVLASIVLPTYVVAPTPIKTKKGTKSEDLTETVESGELIFDHAKLSEVVKVVTRNLNKLIDINYYPVEETRTSNMSERPIGIGVQGLADVFYKLGLPYDSEEAIKLDREIMETIYFSALSSSLELSKKDGPYATFKGSPISKGHFQFDLWKEFPTNKEHVPEINHSGRYDWDKLRREIKKHGVRNSLVTALMPTATTSQIMGSASEAFEPITSNCYTRRVRAGEFIVINPYMATDLIKAGLWNEEMRNKLLQTRGSLQEIKEIPQKLKDIYKTVWELQQKVLIDHSIARAPYVDQSQSLNLYFASGDADKIAKAHFYGWSRGLKTGSYYIRSKPSINSASFTVTKEEEPERIEKSPPKKTPVVEVTEEICDSCGS